MAPRHSSTANGLAVTGSGPISGGGQKPTRLPQGRAPLRKNRSVENPLVVAKKFQNGGPLSIVYRELSGLVPYERNARTHSKSQIEKIKRSLVRFGWTTPIAMAESTIIAGHARTMAATELAREGVSIRGNPDPALAPTIDLSHLSEPERRAYIIADNKLAEEAGWDMSLLKLEFADLSAQGIDLTITGFDLNAASRIMLSEDEPERVLNAREADAMDEAWRRALVEWVAIITGEGEQRPVTTSYTKGVLAVQFLRSLFFGDEFPRGATLAYTPHRHTTNGDKGSIIDAMRAAIAEDGRPVRNSIRWASAEKPSLDKLIGAMTLPIHGMRLPGDFPALLARDLIDEFTEPGARVLDPCHGWGGRMIGYLLSAARSYQGYDPSPETHAGVAAMYADLLPLIPDAKKAAKLLCAPFESARLKPASFDFALTSPPYFDAEKYAGEASSWRMYQSYGAWRDGFYEPLIASVAAALRPGAVFCLQVGSQQYPLKEDAIALAPRHNMVHEDTRHTIMINNRTGTDPDDGEVIVVLRRQL